MPAWPCVLLQVSSLQRGLPEAGNVGRGDRGTRGAKRENGVKMRIKTAYHLFEMMRCKRKYCWWHTEGMEQKEKGLTTN